MWALSTICESDERRDILLATCLALSCCKCLRVVSIMTAGGASLSLHSLTAATLGAAACVPLLMLRVGMWSSQARSQFPVLEEVQRWQAEVSLPILHNMTHVQVLAATPHVLLAGMGMIMHVAWLVCMLGMPCCGCLPNSRCCAACTKHCSRCQPFNVVRF